MVLPTPHCIKQDNHLPPPDPRFGMQDFHVKQPLKTLAYAKVLQHWAEAAMPPHLGNLCKLAECVEELRQCMEPLTTFRDEEFCTKDPPSGWVIITPSQCCKVVGEEAQEAARAQSYSRTQRAHSQGSFLTPLLGHGRHLIVPATTTASTPTTPSRQTGMPDIFSQ